MLMASSVTSPLCTPSIPHLSNFRFTKTEDTFNCKCRGFSDSCFSQRHNQPSPSFLSAFRGSRLDYHCNPDRVGGFGFLGDKNDNDFLLLGSNSAQRRLNRPLRSGEIKSFSTDGWVAPKLSKRADKFMLYVMTAGKKALANGGLTDEMMDELDKTRCGILIGSAMGCMKVFNDGVEALRVSYKNMNPFCVPFATTNMGSAMLSMDLWWMGPNYSISTACARSNFCILSAANHTISGDADLMLCGGSDACIIPIGLGGFVACRALSQRNDNPSKASRPWDKKRDGFVMGEEAGVLLLEEFEHAKKHGAEINAEFLGGSFTCDAYHMTEPHPNGLGTVWGSKDDVNYINAHATSTRAGDLKEYQALIHCFGKNPELRVNSSKSMIGHLLGAAGAVEAVATMQAIRTGWVHPNINLENPDEGMLCS